MPREKLCNQLNLKLSDWMMSWIMQKSKDEECTSGDVVRRAILCQILAEMRDNEQPPKPASLKDLTQKFAEALIREAA
jgi:hypothetical protein